MNEDQELDLETKIAYGLAQAISRNLAPKDFTPQGHNPHNRYISLCSMATIGWSKLHPDAQFSHLPPYQRLLWDDSEPTP